MEPANGVRSALAAIADAIEFESASAFTFGGRPFKLPGERSPEETRSSLLSTLTQQLYERAFCRPFTGVADAALFPETDDMSQALAAANTGKPRWSEGWTIVGVEPSGRITAQLSGMRRSFWPGEYVVPDLPASPPRVGAQARVYVATASFDLQPGFFFIFGESIDDRRDSIEFVRFYWSVEAPAAPNLVRLLSQHLNAFGVPFQLKCQVKAAHYVRLDPVVLYFDRRYFPIVAEIAATVHARNLDQFRPISPLFTKSLAPGLAIAEDPGSGRSFGMHRCGLVAEALYSARERGTTGEGKLEAIERHFAGYGFSLDRPYLNPGSIDDYDFPYPEPAA